MTTPARSDDQTETVATFRHDGAEYQIDHLGILHPAQFGQYAIYRDGVQVDEFVTLDSGLRENHRPAVPTTSTEELIWRATARIIEIEADARFPAAR